MIARSCAGLASSRDRPAVVSVVMPAVPAGVAARAVARVAHGSEAEETEAEGETDHGMSFHL